MSLHRAIQRPINTLNLARISPKRGEVYHLRSLGQAGRSMRKYAESWVVAALQTGESVHWIDGASRINPARFLNRFPPDESNVHDHLHRLFIGRGFTVHQLATLIERLAREVSITGSPLVVIDAPISMHLDAQIGDHEARCLMRRLMEEVQSIATKQQTAIILITDKEPKSKRHQQLLRMVEQKSTQQLSEDRPLRGKGARCWLSHSPSGLSGMWPTTARSVTLFHAVERLKGVKSQGVSNPCTQDGRLEGS